MKGRMLLAFWLGLAIVAAHAQIVQFSGSAGSSGGGYNNLTNWPQINGLSGSTQSNRPVVVNGVMTWIGPVGGGPSTASDTLQTQTLTPSSPVTSTSSGQVISGLMINCSSNCITVAHNNVTVRLNLTSINTYPGLGIMIQAGVTGTVIEDNEVIGQNSQAQGGIGCIGGANITTPMQQTTIRRNNVFGCEKGIAWGHQGLSGAQNLYIDNLIHGVSGTDCDMFQFYVTNGNDFYADLEHNYGSSADYVVNAEQTLGSITGGSGYTPGTYYSIPMTGGSGQGLTANVTVNGSGVVSAVTVVWQGRNYAVSDALSASTTYLGPGSGFSVPIATVDSASSLADSFINMTNYNGSDTISNITFNNNGSDWSGNSTVHPYLADNTQGTGSITALTATNNMFYGASGSYSEIKSGVTFTTNSGNYIGATSQATSGSATNGTGVIWLLRRDLDPASNDNTPMWLDDAA